MSLLRLSVLFPPGLERPITEAISADASMPGFTLLHAEGHSSDFSRASSAEQVRGRIQRRVLWMVMEADRLDDVLQLLRTHVDCRDVRWWIDPCWRWEGWDEDRLYGAAVRCRPACAGSAMVAGPPTRGPGHRRAAQCGLPALGSTRRGRRPAPAPPVLMRSLQAPSSSSATSTRPEADATIVNTSCRWGARSACPARWRWTGVSVSRACWPRSCVWTMRATRRRADSWTTGWPGCAPTHSAERWTASWRLCGEHAALARRVQVGDAAQKDLDLLGVDLAQTEAQHLAASTAVDVARQALTTDFPSLSLPERVPEVTVPQELTESAEVWARRIVERSHEIAALEARMLPKPKPLPRAAAPTASPTRPSACA